MKSKNADMLDIFCELTEKNKDILILVAKGIKVAQEADCQKCEASNYGVRAKKRIAGGVGREWQEKSVLNVSN